MRTIFRLAVAALVANVTWHAWLVSSAYYRFRDAVQTASQTFAAKPDDEVKGRVLDLAAQYDVPLKEDDFTLRRGERQVFIDGTYVQRVDVAPGLSFPWTFVLHIDSSYGSPLTIKDVVPERKALPKPGQPSPQ
jgi:hypothetical protein